MDNTVISALELRILLHYYYSPDPWGSEGGVAVNHAFSRFYAEGLLDRCDGGRTYLTEKGKFYVEHILATPFPEMKRIYIIPER